MVVVVVLIGVMATLAAFAIGKGANRNRLRSETRELLGALRFCQQMASTRSSLGMGISCAVRFYNEQEYGLEEQDPTSAPLPAGVDPGTRVAEVTQGLGLRRRIGDLTLRGNVLGAPPLPATDRIYFTNSKGEVRRPTGTQGDWVIFTGRSGSHSLPYLPSGAEFDRIVLHDSPSVPAPRAATTYVIRLTPFHPPGPTSFMITPWIELSPEDRQAIP